jgi:hypothetical protein
MNSIVREEVDECIQKYMPECDTWTEVTVYKTLIDIIAQVSGRVFVGPELCKDPEYLDCARNYTMDLIDSITAIKGQLSIFTHSSKKEKKLPKMKRSPTT